MGVAYSVVLFQKFSDESTHTKVMPRNLIIIIHEYRSTRSVRKVSDRIFLCEHLMDYNLARLHEPTLNLSAHA